MFRFILGGSKKKETKEKPNADTNFSEDPLFKESFIQITSKENNISVNTVDDVTIVEINESEEPSSQREKNEKKEESKLEMKQEQLLVIKEEEKSCSKDEKNDQKISQEEQKENDQQNILELDINSQLGECVSEIQTKLISQEEPKKENQQNILELNNNSQLKISKQECVSEIQTKLISQEEPKKENQQNILELNNNSQLKFSQLECGKEIQTQPIAKEEVNINQIEETSEIEVFVNCLEPSLIREPCVPNQSTNNEQLNNSNQDQGQNLEEQKQECENQMDQKEVENKSEDIAHHKSDNITGDENTDKQNANEVDNQNGVSDQVQNQGFGEDDNANQSSEKEVSNQIQDGVKIQNMNLSENENADKVNENVDEKTQNIDNVQVQNVHLDGVENPDTTDIVGKKQENINHSESEQANLCCENNLEKKGEDSNNETEKDLKNEKNPDDNSAIPEKEKQQSIDPRSFPVSQLLEQAIQTKYNKQDVLFFHDPESVEEVVRGENGEFRSNSDKAEKLLKIFEEVSGEQISRVRGDGNCLFRSIASNFMLTRIGLAYQNVTNIQIINQIFDEMQLIPLLIPTNQSETLGSTFSREEITCFVYSNLERIRTSLINSENLIQTIVFSLNDPFVDFSLQVWIKSLLVHGLKQAIDNKVYPLDSLVSLSDFEKQVAPLNCESGDDILFQLVSYIFNSELSIVRIQMNGGLDHSKLEPLEPRISKSCLQLNIPIGLWYKTGHYYILYTKDQIQFLS